MKKLFTGLALMLLSTSSYAIAFECKGYADGAQVGETIKVNAAKAIVAETKAIARMKKAGLKVDYVRCSK